MQARPTKGRVSEVKRLLAVFLLAPALMSGASAEDQPVECLESGCTLIPNSLIERNSQVIDKMMKELIRLRAITGCA